MYSNNIKYFLLLTQENYVHATRTKAHLVEQLKDETNFLPNNAPIRERLWYVEHDTNQTPICQCCDNVVKWHTQKRKFNTFCSKKCSNEPRKGIHRSEDVIHKIKQTKRNNPKNAWNKGIPMSDEQKQNLSNKRKQMYQSGKIVHWNSGNNTNQETKNKISQTLLAQNLTMSESSKEKQSQTLEKMKQNGWIPPSCRPEVIEKRKQTSLQKHGVKNHKQKHMKDVLPLLQDKDWVYNEHILKQKSLMLISKELNINGKTTDRYLHNHGFDTKHFIQSTGENEVGDFIKKHTDIVIRNIRTIIGKELDIYLPEHNLAIEYCGLYYHSERYKDSNYHLDKLNRCQNKGIRLITMFEDEWLENKNIVKEKLLNIIGKSKKPRIFARKCEIVNVTKKLKKEFLNEHHIQTDGKSSINIGLTYENTLVAVMCFFKRKEGVYELNRFATSANIVGGFSKLLKYFQRNIEYQEIISFADRRWSNGAVYENNGFTLEKINKPDYSYTRKQQRYHKFQFRHKQLKTKLKNYDHNLTEHQNCLNHNIYRIYNCGLLKYTIKNPS